MNRLFAGGVAIATAVTPVSCASAGAEHAPIVAHQTSVEHDSRHPDVDAIILVDSKNSPPYKSEAELIHEIREADRGIRYATRSEHGLGEIAIRTIAMQPDGSIMSEGKKTPCYSNKLIQQIRDTTQRNAPEKKTADMIFVENHTACNEAGAWATLAPNDQYTVYKDGLNYMLSGTIMHEVGHTLGLGHVSEFNCQIEEKDGYSKLYDFGTIQDLIKEGCKTVTYKDGKKKGEINPYSSNESVMGSGTRWQPDSYVPAYSSVEMSKLDKKLIIKDIPATPGKYYVSFEKGKTLGVKLHLPEDHALRAAVPNATDIVFAPSIYGQVFSKEKDYSLESPNNINMIVPFVISDKHNNMTSLRTSLFTHTPTQKDCQNTPNLCDPEQGDSLQAFIYADKQLDIAVRAGIDTSGYFVDITSLDDPNTQRKMNEVITETRKRNDLVAKTEKEPAAKSID